MRAVAGVVLLMVAALAGCSTGDSRPTPALPRLGAARDVYDGDFGDPVIVPDHGGFALFGTDDWPAHIPTATSPDDAHWTHGPDAVPVEPAWANPDPRNSLTWAPAALSVGGQHLLYVSVQDAAAQRQCIAVLRSSDILGPYVDARGSPLVCQLALGGSIDPSVTSIGGSLHMVWKSDGNCCGLPTSLWEQDLSPDGLRVTGSAHRLLTADEAWQGGIVENPALLPAAGGGWWLFYSGNRFDVPAYATGLAWCPSLQGGCRETSDRPFLAGTATEFSPGGTDFFRDNDGRLWAAFATWNRPPRNGRFYCCRSLDLAPVLAA